MLDPDLATSLSRYAQRPLFRANVVKIINNFYHSCKPSEIRLTLVQTEELFLGLACLLGEEEERSREYLAICLKSMLKSEPEVVRVAVEAGVLAESLECLEKEQQESIRQELIQLIHEMLFENKTRLSKDTLDTQTKRFIRLMFSGLVSSEQEKYAELVVSVLGELHHEVSLDDQVLEALLNTETCRVLT